jgi:hypothetical protein
MVSSPTDVNDAVSAAVHEYRQHGDIASLLDRMKALSIAADPLILAAAAAPFHDLPEVVIPVYERIVAARPTDAQAMVILANAYWLTGRGADMVGILAARAMAADADNRGAWHLWALSGSCSAPARLDLAVRTYEGLWAEASRDEERRALEETISKLKGWSL